MGQAKRAVESGLVELVESIRAGWEELTAKAN